MRLTLSLIFLLTTLKNKSVFYIIYVKEISIDLYLRKMILVGLTTQRYIAAYIFIDNEQSLLSCYPLDSWARLMWGRKWHFPDAHKAHIMILSNVLFPTSIFVTTKAILILSTCCYVSMLQLKSSLNKRHGSSIQKSLLYRSVCKVDVEKNKTILPRKMRQRSPDQQIRIITCFCVLWPVWSKKKKK